MFTRECTAAVRPADARARFRDGLVTSTGGWSDGHVQANLVSVPRRYAVDLRRFAVRNARACPVLDIVGAGRFTTALAQGADLRRDLPAYRVWRGGAPAESCTEVSGFWRDDLVTFLLGCSFTFEGALERAGVPLRHIEQGRHVPMYRTDRGCVPAWRFRAPLVVSMRPIPERLVARAAAVSGGMPFAHGAPVYAGSPAMLGIRDLDRPEYGEAVALAEGDVPVFWACGVTMLEAVAAARLPFAITHEPGHMLITDRRAKAAGRGDGRRRRSR